MAGATSRQTREKDVRKIVVSRPGGPEVLELVTSPVPSLGAGQVLVDVEAAGVNYLDVYLRNGALPFSAAFTPGLEGVGRVVDVASGVSTPTIGDRVAWINGPGSYANQIMLPAEQAIVLPPGFSTANALLFQGVTAQYLLAEYRDTKPGDVVLVQAAAGGVGQILVQWLKHLGAVVIGTASTEEKLQTIRALGADHAVNYSQGFLEEELDLTNGRGVDLALDAVGRATFSSSVKALAKRGLAIAYGQASGVASDVQVYPLIEKGARVASATIFVYIENAAEMQGRAAAVIRGIEEGWLQMGQTADFALGDAAFAHRALESRTSQGKLALIPTR
jgi:NADPH2:quinone reductase